MNTRTPAGPAGKKSGLFDGQRRQFLQSLAAGGAYAALPHIWARAAADEMAAGTVFHDRDGDGRPGADDVGLEGVVVSNGRDVVRTDAKGRWRLPVLPGKATDFFVVQPSGWTAPVSADLLPRHYYLHQPAGSPRQRYAGLPPTGPLPASIDFPLLPAGDSENFRMLVCGDPQPRNPREVDYLAQSSPAALREAGGLFGLTLGDVAFDDLSIYPSFNQVMAATGIPWRHVLGNHDLNFDSRDDTFAHETFRRMYGPTYYSFNHGRVHFVVLNNVRWTGPDPAAGRDRGRYHGELGETQRQWLEADLAEVPRDHLVALFFHIPLRGEGADTAWSATADRKQLYHLLRHHPHTLSFAAHRHYHRHDFIKEDGWPHPAPHHHLVVGTLCGSWFRGRPDAFGVPHGTMGDGTPRGFIAVDFKGNTYNIDGYRAIGAPAGQQMHIYLPRPELTVKEAAGAAYHVNFYNGSERSTLKARLGPDDPWRVLERVVEPDPYYVALVEAEGALAAPWLTLRKDPDACSHLWRGRLPEGLGAGEQVIEVLAEDGFGNTARQLRVIRLTA